MKIKISQISILIILFSSNIACAQWETVYFGDLPFLSAVKFRDFNNGITVGGIFNPNGCILKTIDNGTTWDTVYVTTDTLWFSDVTYANNSTIFAVGRSSHCCDDEGIIAKSLDSGRTWATTMKTVGLNQVCFPSTNIGYILGDYGTLLKTINSGILWDSLNTSCSLNSIYFINDTIGFGCGQDTIIKTINGGLSWTIQNLSSGRELDKIFFPSDSIGYSKTGECFDSVKIYKTVNQGSTWTLQSIFNPTACLTSMFFTNKDTGYIVGQFKVLKTIDGGSSWHPQSSSLAGWADFYDDLMDVFFLNNDTGFIVGRSTFFRTTTGGILTSVMDLKNPSDIMSIFPNPVSKDLTLTFKYNTSEQIDIKIFDVFGQQIFTKKISKNITSINLDVSTFAQGIYFIQLNLENNTLTRKFLKE